MNMLTRRNSNKSVDQEGTGPGLGNSVSGEKRPEEAKPSLLRRLSRSISRSQEKPTQGHGQTPVPHVEHPKVETPRAKTPVHKVVEPAVDELKPPRDIHHAVSTEAPILDPASPQEAVSHGQFSATTGGMTMGSVVDTDDSPLAKHPEHSASIIKHKLHRPSSGLTKADIHHLFSGAPQFTLEKGRRGRYFPQAFFPWDNELEISDLQDRRFLRHESFALATLHAHLPIPDEVNWKPGMAPPARKEGLDTGKRPMFELGVFERPNMLGLEGKEPGTVGMRYFLERPVADGIQDERVKEHGKDVEIDLPLSSIPAFEAFKSLAISKDNDEMNAKVGKHAPEQDRAKLIHGGPHAWKNVGVRNISMGVLAGRLQQICEWRDEIVKAGWYATVLDSMKTEELHNHLFNEMLFPPRKINADVKHHKSGLKIQIEALVKVLTTPGAWLDLSAPEARLRFGKILHSRTTRYDSATGTMTIDPERKWLLIQMLLSLELVIRLDAALRLGIAMHSDDFELSSDEIHHFNKLRNLKVDWDLVAARRFLALCYVKKVGKRAPSPSSEGSAQLSKVKSPERHGGILGGIRHVLSLDDDKPESTVDDCDLAILPRQPRVMLDGLVRFAHNIGWPRWEELQQQLERKLCRDDPAERERFLLDIMSCAGPAEAADTRQPRQLTPSLEKFCVNLHPATANTIGGWLSHSWLSGMILPGSSICDILMSTLLENDPDPSTLQHLGSRGLPMRRCGFVLNGSSWWAKSSIVGRVMAPLRGSKESMGWIYLPNFVPLDEATSVPVSNRWIKIKSWAVPTTRDRPRIFDGDKLAVESSPLGIGKGKILGSEFSMVTDHIFDSESAAEVKVNSIQLHLSSTNATQSSPDHPLAAWAHFDLSITDPRTPDAPVSRQVRYGLDRGVYFVTAYPCRLPHGHATIKPGDSHEHHKHGHEHGHQHDHQHPRHKPAEHIPAHPLHKTYKFVTKSLQDLIDNPDLSLPLPGAASHHEVWIIDARDALPPRPHDPTSQALSPTSPSLLPLSPTFSPTLSPTLSPSSPPYDLDSSLSPMSPSALESPLQDSLSGQLVDTPTSSSAHEHHRRRRHGHDLSYDPDPQLWEKDIFVRAWCAEKGRNAIIARVGRTCLSCAIREARALEIAIIIRIGVKEVS